MKKFFMMAVMAVAALSANAQYAPEKGDFSTAIKFNPFHSSGKTFEAVDDYAVMGRYMITDKDAVRATLGFGYKNEKNEEADVVDPNKTVELNGSATTFSFKVGYERHFAANDRIDLYAGAQVGFSTTSSNEESQVYYMDNNNNKVPLIVETKNGTAENNVVKPTSPNTFSFGVFTGINFYVYKKLFVGAEIGFNYGHGSYKDVEYPVLKDNKWETKTAEMNNTTSSLGFKVEPQLTLGWTF